MANWFDFNNNSAGELGIGNPGSYGGQNTTSSMYDNGTGVDSGFNLGEQDWGGWAKGAGSLMGGVGGLAQAWQGMQGLKLAKKSLAQQQENWDKNYAAQQGAYRDARGDRSAARGRSNSGTFVA